MNDQIGTKPADVKRVVFKQIVEGDFRKFVAQSNDAETGGGARDLRFRPFDEFVEVFRLLFPAVRREKRRREGGMIDIEILVGRLHWFDGGNDASKEATFEPPTDARPNEGRLPIVHKYPPFNHLPSTDKGRMVLLLVQRDDDTVWVEFASEDSLRSGEWHDAVAQPILRSLDAKRGFKQVARGFIDLMSGKEYSDA
jgi:hypothetical protein